MSPVTLAAQLFDLTGEVAIVTGASSGLGARFAEVLAAHGAKVVLAARRLERIEGLAKRLPEAQAMTLDVTQPDSFPALFDAAEKSFGTVTLLVNNAGVASAGRYVDTPASEWERIRSTNVDAVWHLSQQFAKRLIAAKNGGAIVNIASTAGYRVNGVSAAYAVSKAAVVQMTNALALDLARHQIRVNAIAPGFISSEMTEAYLMSEAGKAYIKRVPQRRAGEPPDLDGILLLLASRKASGFLTGTTIVADGGDMLS